MPYPNEHAARIREPGTFDPKTYTRESDGKMNNGTVTIPPTIDRILGVVKATGERHTQALRFPTKTWTEAGARKWLKDNLVKAILFEPASGEEKPAGEKRRQSADPAGSIRLSQGGELLRAAGFKVDREAGILHNVSFITAGVALGHDFEIDAKMLRQVAGGIKAAGQKGVKSRLTHPRAGIFSSAMSDPVLWMIGRAGGDVRIKGEQVVGDIRMGKYAKSSPMGNLWEYVCDLAEDDATIAGTSIVFVPDQYEDREDKDGRPTLPPFGRVKEMIAVDVVGDPGANPGGLPAGPGEGQ